MDEYTALLFWQLGYKSQRVAPVQEKFLSHQQVYITKTVIEKERRMCNKGTRTK